MPKIFIHSSINISINIYSSPTDRRSAILGTGEKVVNDQTRLERMRSMFPIWLSQPSTSPSGVEGMVGSGTGVHLTGESLKTPMLVRDPNPPSPKLESVSGTGGKK